MIQKAASEKIIDLDTMVVSVIKIIDVDAEVSAEKTIVALVFEIDGGDINTGIILIDRI